MAGSLQRIRDKVDFGVESGLVYFGSIGVVVARAEDGRRIIDKDVSTASLIPHQGLSASECEQPLTPTSGVVVNMLGQELHRSTEYLRAADLSVTTEPNLPLFSKGNAFDFATGERLWSAETIGDNYPSPYSIVGDRVLITGNGSVRALDLRTGEHLWDNSSLGDATVVETDGERVMVESDASIAAIDLATGAVAWEIGAGSGEGARARLAAGGEGLVGVLPESLTFYAPTGGPSSAPGMAPTLDENSADEGGLITKCGRAPTMIPVEYRTDTGGLVVKMKIKAVCPGGDILADSATRISISDGGQNVASALFDLSTNPIVLPRTIGTGDGSVTHEFLYPPGDFWRLPNTLNTGNCSIAAGNQLVECEEMGGSSGSAQPTSAARDSGRSGRTYAASASANPSRGDAESSSFDALRAQANVDRPIVQGDLVNRWVPQLSTKQPGLFADGITWNNKEILREHLDYRVRFPEARLLWTGDWSTFSYSDWWVTIAGVTFPDGASANAWCASKGFDADHCFAKLVSNSRGPDGTTVYRK